MFPEESLPDTGVGLEWEKAMQSIFVDYEAYGTRSSTVILYDITGEHLTYTERAGAVDEKGQLDIDRPWVSNTFHVPLNPQTTSTTTTSSGATVQDGEKEAD